MKLVLHYSPMSSATRVHWALEEVGVPYDKVRVDLGAKEQKKPEYLAINPNGKVPALIVDGEPMFESIAMIIFLGEMFGVDKGLYPPLGVARAQALKWITWSGVTLAEAGFRLMLHTSERFPADEQNAKAGERGRADLNNLLAILDGSLEGKQYLVGDAFTFADLSLASLVPFVARIGADLGPYKRLNEWSGRCMQRPALARVMAG